MLGAQDRMEREVTLSRSQAWHVAALSRAKKMPDHDTITGRRKPSAKKARRDLTAAGHELAAAWGAPPESLAALKGA